MDYNKIGLKAGLEIHQQLDTRHKLFCKCPTLLRGKREANLRFKRYLRVAKSEMGEVDKAAEEEEKYGRTFVYKGYDSTCLVENDEEPPGELNKEALDISLEIALLLNMNVVDEIHTMRKIVIDGSNTGGFQRTALIATDGGIETEEGFVRINSLCLEEEAAQKIEGSTEEDKEGNITIYSLDRLGIPLIEIGTTPDIRTPEQAKKVAEHIGMVLQSTGRVKRGMGTVRQDINISIEGGTRVEIKGVQRLGMVEDVVKKEVIRQVNLIKIKEKLSRSGAYVEHSFKDVSKVFEQASWAKKAGGKVFVGCLRKFSGILWMEIQPSRTFGNELKDIADRYGVGLIHTDELPLYIREEEVENIRCVFDASEDDCLFIIAAGEEKAEKVLKAVMKRAEEVMKGVPEETRKILPNGCTAYMRPLPGAARMYPETDVTPIEAGKEWVERIKSTLPETFGHRKKRYMEKYGLNEELAYKISRANFSIFEKIMGIGIGIVATLVAKTLTDTLNELAHEEIEVENLEDHHFIDLFKMLSARKFGKEAIPAILRFLAVNPEKCVEEAIEEIGVKALSTEEVERLIEELVNSKRDFISEKGLRAVEPLMGLLMKDLRGKVDGKEINKILRDKVALFLSSVRSKASQKENLR